MWPRTTWGAVSDLKYGKALRGYSADGGTVEVFGTNGPIGWTGESLANGPRPVVGRKGAYRGVHLARGPFWVIDTAYWLEPSGDIDPVWAYYNLLTVDINGMDSGSAIPSLTKSHFVSMPLFLPPLDEQRRIAEVLGALDDLIDANRRLIEGITLLALQCSLGPSGAEYRPLAELYEVGLSGVWGEDQASGSSSLRVAVLRGKDLEEIVSGQEASPPFRFLSQKQIDSRIPKLGEIWTAGSGSLGPSMPITDELADVVGWDRVLYSNFVKRLVPLVENDWYGVAWGAMVRAWRSGNFAGFRTGTAMPNLDSEAMLKGIQVPVLTVAERAEVNRLVSRALAPELRQEIAQLRRTSDELLPLLMSGAVRVQPEGVAA